MNPALTAVLLLLASAAAVADGTAPAAQASPVLQQIDQKLLLQYLADQSAFTLLDARPPEQYGASHISGAINVPPDQFDEFRAALPADKAAPIVVYCRTGQRALELSGVLRAQGYRNVRVLPAEQIFWSDEAPPVFKCGA